uniref:Upstream binding transcription factor, like n=1 Tax=Cyclopterus lumpus TaxID=8103 RepID=A0A8C2ZYW0_CYCLU
MPHLAAADLSVPVDDWTKEDCLTLLERIRSLLPDDDGMKYKTTESHYDWDKVGFGRFSGDTCRHKWQKVSSEVRKYRTMTELIVDAMEFVKNPYKGKKLKTHPDFPKKPLTPYFRFFMEKRAKYAKIHPEMSNLDLTKILSKKYKELPDKKKQKYVTEFQQEKEAFEKNMARFKEEHPELIEERKKSDLPEKPKTPQQLWYNHEKKTYMKLHPEGSMRAYHEAHPDVTSDDHVRSVLTKAERQLKDKFDGRPTKPPPNGYSLYCAELMVNMKDVPSTERMVLCSKRWKLMTQKEKDMFQKRCEQRKKQYDVDLQRFLESLPDEERDRVMGEEKPGGSRGGVASSPHRAKSLAKVGTVFFSQTLVSPCLLFLMTLNTSPVVSLGREAEPETWTPAGQPKDRRDGKKTAKLPETPKTAEEMWQHSVMGDYLAKYRSDRRKAQAAVEAAWKSMEKKEKIPWIKKAAEDQKRYERELLDMRTPPAAQNQRKPKFDGEPKKPPVSGYQMFSQELLTNGELNHFSLKERMVEIGKRWHKLTQSQKDKYKKMVEEQQGEYKAELEDWVEVTSRNAAGRRRQEGNGVQSQGNYRGVFSLIEPSVRSVRVCAVKQLLPVFQQDMSDSTEKSDSSDSDEDDETSGSTDSDDVSVPLERMKSWCLSTWRQRGC